uniref:NADH dehydrogenase subunit 2 n=1 Tax=Bolbosoma nipponicum TaxID=1167864 RepID=UPI002E763154|nr:NADH dehydrogenase subunit 2 [Bolbosoma nipponicum]WPN89840.1 NADH dehydrogenase subunit 2 [Bolbosoma nipponicum]
MWAGGVSVLLLWVMYLGVLASGLVSSSYIVVWGALELGLILTMTYLVWSDDRMGSVLYYYIVQAFSSLFMIVGVVVESPLVVVGGVVVKLGLFPAFAWVVSVVWGMGLSWGVLMVLFAQKMIPLVLVARWGWLVDCGSEVFVALALLSVVVGSMLMSYGMSVKWLVVMSSLVHTGWLLFILLGNPGSFLFYFSVYGGMLLLLLLLVSYGEVLGTAGVLVTLSSIPPVVGFLFKFYSLGLMGQGFLVFLFVGLVVVVAAIVGYFINMLLSLMVQTGGLSTTYFSSTLVVVATLILCFSFVYV